MNNDIKKIYEGNVISLNVEHVNLPNGNHCSLEIVHHPGAVAIVPILDNGDIILVRQYRHAAGGYILEVPAGKLDIAGEEPEECAKRELIEEVGYASDDLTLLTTIFTTPGFSDEIIHLYKAEKLKKDQIAHEPDEVMSIEIYSKKEVHQMICDKKITDAKSICALLLAL